MELPLGFAASSFAQCEAPGKPAISLSLSALLYKEKMPDFQNGCEYKMI